MIFDPELFLSFQNMCVRAKSLLLLLVWIAGDRGKDESKLPRQKSHCWHCDSFWSLLEERQRWVLCCQFSESKIVRTKFWCPAPPFSVKALVLKQKLMSNFMRHTFWVWCFQSLNFSDIVCGTKHTNDMKSLEVNRRSTEIMSWPVTRNLIQIWVFREEVQIPVFTLVAGSCFCRAQFQLQLRAWTRGPAHIDPDSAAVWRSLEWRLG